MLISFRQILLDEMTKEDMRNLAENAQLDPDLDEQFIYGKLATSEMLPWRVETDKGNTIMLLEIRQKKNEKVLFVWYLGGHGLLGNGKFVLETLVEFAKINSCSSIETLINNPSFAKYLRRVGFYPSRSFVKKEIN